MQMVTSEARGTGAGEGRTVYSGDFKNWRTASIIQPSSSLDDIAPFPRPSLLIRSGCDSDFMKIWKSLKSMLKRVHFLSENLRIRIFRLWKWSCHNLDQKLKTRNACDERRAFALGPRRAYPFTTLSNSSASWRCHAEKERPGGTRAAVPCPCESLDGSCHAWAKLRGEQCCSGFSPWGGSSVAAARGRRGEWGSHEGSRNDGRSPGVRHWGVARRRGCPAIALPPRGHDGRRGQGCQGHQGKRSFFSLACVEHDHERDNPLFTSHQGTPGQED